MVLQHRVCLARGGWYHHSRCTQGVESDRQDKPLSEVHAMFTVETGVSTAKIGHFRSARECVKTQCLEKSATAETATSTAETQISPPRGKLERGFPPPGKPALGTPTAGAGVCGGLRNNPHLDHVLLFRPGIGVRSERGLWQGGAGDEKSQHGASLGRVAARLRGGRRGA